MNLRRLFQFNLANDRFSLAGQGETVQALI